MISRILVISFFDFCLISYEDLSSRKYTGIRSLFNEHFVKTGKVPVKMGRFYSRIFDFWQKADYGDFAEFEKEKVKECLDQT